MDQSACQRSPLLQRLALAGIVLLSAALNTYQLNTIGINGIGNLYYAAGVKSMLTSPHNFFYLSFDPTGFLALDKAPIALWLQALSAWLFGFHGVALLLPQVVAGILSVFVLYCLVGRTHGVGAGLLSALALAIMPISVVTNRNNTPDALLVLMLLLAAWAVLLATEQGSLGWLLAGAALVGLAFNVKMLQVLLVAPALAVLFIVSSPLPWGKRLLHGLLACVAALAVAVPWLLVVQLTPPGQRPYIGGSTNNSVLDLVFGYNGLARLWAEDWTSEVGTPGPLRLLGYELGGQVGWLLPLALVGLVVAVWQVSHAETGPERTRRSNALVLWTTWLVVAAAYFSVSLFFHRYYLATLAPAVAALAGIGGAALWTSWCRGNRHRVWALVGLALTAGVQSVLLLPFAGWNVWLIPLVGIWSTIALAVLVLAWRKGWDCVTVVMQAAFAFAVTPLLIAPLVWSAIPVATCVDHTRPYGGPQVYGPAQECEPFANRPFLDRALVDYLLDHRQGATYLAATYDLSVSGLGILETGQPFMTLGGYRGNDPILTLQQFVDYVARGDVRYYVGMQLEAEYGVQWPILEWVRAYCPEMPAVMKGVEVRGPCSVR